MTPNMWGWICAALGTDVRPLIDVSTGLGANVYATSTAPEYGGVAEPSAGNLQVLLVLYGYSAFASGRQPKAISVLSGTGLVPQSL
jgi:hypothetical protein